MPTTVGDPFHCCNRIFKTARALEQHVEDSPRHAHEQMASSTASSVQRGGSVDMDEAEENVQTTWVRALETKNETDQSQQDSPKHPDTKVFDIYTSILSLGYQPFSDGWERDEGASLIDTTPAGKEEGASKLESKKPKHRRRNKRRNGRAYQSSGVTSGRGSWYLDVGDNHALCDRDCGWCGHCAEEAGF